MNPPPSLEQLAEQFAQWRANKSNGEPTPTALRQGVIALLEQRPISQIVNTLKLSHSSIKAWQRQQSPTPDFIAMPAPERSEKHWLALEVDGQALTLTTDLPPDALGILVRQLLTSNEKSHDSTVC